MSEEAAVTESVESKSSSTPQDTWSFADVILADQGLTEVSEAELRGEEVPDDTKTEESTQAEEVKEVKEAEEAEETDAKEGDDAKEDNEVEDKSEAKKTEPPPPKTEPPPKGFVPTAALREAREENKVLRAKLQQLEQQVKEPPIEEPEVSIPKVRPDFKVLTKEAFKELAEESPQEALTYLAELEEYKEAKRFQAEQATRKQARQREVERILSESAAQMTEVIPDIFEEGSTSRQELTEFAETIGFTKDMFYLTNPETLVILPGETEPLYLGTQAASIIKMLAGLKDKVKGSTAKEQELRKQIEAEVLSKVKTSGKQGFKSIADIPTSKSSAPFGNKVLSEQEVARLSPKDLEAYLSGKL